MKPKERSSGLNTGKIRGHCSRGVLCENLSMLTLISARLGQPDDYEVLEAVSKLIEADLPRFYRTTKAMKNRH
jgi:hypothetical protein